MSNIVTNIKARKYNLKFNFYSLGVNDNVLSVTSLLMSENMSPNTKGECKDSTTQGKQKRTFSYQKLPSNKGNCEDWRSIYRKC